MACSGPGRRRIHRAAAASATRWRSRAPTRPPRLTRATQRPRRPRRPGAAAATTPGQRRSSCRRERRRWRLARRCTRERIRNTRHRTPGLPRTRARCPAALTRTTGHYRRRRRRRSVPWWSVGPGPCSWTLWTRCASPARRQISCHAPVFRTAPRQRRRRRRHRSGRGAAQTPARGKGSRWKPRRSTRAATSRAAATRGAVMAASRSNCRTQGRRHLTRRRASRGAFPPAVEAMATPH
mmetsp:Transcript_41818/g.131013  ORF Transcript_41818/g.131013 Transcript_41818/m.131013 type:complete len:238 (-) Transcript_41818:712-1425(-)